MALSLKAQHILDRIAGDSTKLGDLRAIAKDIKKDHSLAMELWSTGQYYLRQLAILIMDKKLLSQELVDELFDDIAGHPADEGNQLADWLMANQLSKDKNTIAFMESWQRSSSRHQRRLFWYYQGRLRWVGQAPPSNTESRTGNHERSTGGAMGNEFYGRANWNISA